MIKKGLLYSLLSAVLLSTMNLFVKMLGSSIPSGEIAFFRGLFGTVAVLVVMYMKGIRFSTEDRGLLIMRGLYGGFGMVCNFIALVHMKMSDATILFQTSGIFVFIFSALFLKEAVPKGAGKWLILIFLAVMVMVNPFSYESFTWYAVIALLGAALSAAAYTTIRSISKHGQHSNFEIMAYFLVTGMIAGLVTTDGFVLPQGVEWLIILAIGSITVVAQFFLTGAFIATNAVVAQFLQYIGVFISAFYGFLFFGESLAIETVLAGIAMFIASVMLARLKEQAGPIKDGKVIEDKIQ
ncbi:DMT family transporter [Veillonella caviae]|uniref:DMT family transporter n=1 Tax=Veillonella caviae TaxID=248316 RepID=UPI0023A7D7C8|nr:DMT family transporter [Veillonella caviae]MCI5708709.1 DMT family transporter [Veillonella caviae]MCI6406356.1 DMT family transporter [Veillonella caviae]MCI7692954.1 DMT family transporter [Veillonella caviae]MDD7291441.1 DMT family transporter [Veillonella caviae]MDY4745912.1 DMT family transporter [Veillonella caviae]